MPLFAKNFEQNLIAGFNEEGLAEAQKFLQEFLMTDTLEGRSFLDAGCGSGVFTLAAHQLKAQVTSFDIDAGALENVKTLFKKFDKDEWAVTLRVGDILDSGFVNSLGKFDVVMCWGVTHHTGQLWNSLTNISRAVKPGGLIHLGIYNHADTFGFYPDGRFGTSEFWKRIKKAYVALPSFMQIIVDYSCVALVVLIYLFTLNNPIKKLKSNERRGMTWQSDLKDWLIGYPYEYAKPEQVFDFMKNMDFTLEKLKTNNGLLTNNYVFRKKEEKPT